MSETCPTVKIKTDAPDNEQGYILINESDFDPAVHELLDPPAKKPSKGLTVDEIKATLTAMGIAFTDNLSKAGLQALLDAAPAA